MAQATLSATTTSPWRRRLSMVQDALLVVVSALFFYAHARNAIDGRLTSVGFAVEQGLLVVMFLTRRRSFATSTRPFDWVVAAGGWLPLLMRPADSPTTWAALMGSSLQILGLVGTCTAFLYLGKSFGVVAANRGLKVSGPYRFVRHPIYLTHTITAMGFVLANFTPINLGILVALTACQVLRLKAEERILTETDEYAAYAARVRWRLVPGLF
ncbi:MAG TPA: isoprenylcysteine carboxylmethyltransferase family protein [Tepidiformaceae bacterium]|nr:isoprenylcysteine carboxylmethyltransferase family protein [Tepidiformaceae bacterium]